MLAILDSSFENILGVLYITCCEARIHRIQSIRKLEQSKYQESRITKSSFYGDKAHKYTRAKIPHELRKDCKEPRRSLQS
jgi:hypothetical protein